MSAGVQQPYSSAMCVPSDKKGFKRSLSFGGATPNQGRPSCVTVRPCKTSCSWQQQCAVEIRFPPAPPTVGTKQLEYMNEVKEFEAEVQKHSDRYPHDILCPICYVPFLNVTSCGCIQFSRFYSLTFFLHWHLCSMSSSTGTRALWSKRPQWVA